MNASSKTVNDKTMPLFKGEEASNWLSQSNAHAKSQVKSWSSANDISKVVSQIIETVAAEGDQGLRSIAKRIGDKEPSRLNVGNAEIEAIENRLDKLDRDVIQMASSNIANFNERVMESFRDLYFEKEEYGCGFNLVPVRRVACYIPGGRYPLASTALMTAVTARSAGVADVCIVSPQLCDEVIYAGTRAGVTEFHEIGGAQAIAAMALGTETIDPVDMIVGPGNAYVTEAKRQLFGIVGIDMLAGPSEVTVIADGGANAEWVALDLLAQAEHDPSSRVYLLTNDLEVARAVQIKLSELLSSNSFPNFVPDVLSQSAILVLNSLEECARFTNAIAPEHLELMVADSAIPNLSPLLKNYGAKFEGYNACVPFGDYMAGPNHTLPTNKAARFAGSLSPLTFLRMQTTLRVFPNPHELASKTARFADIEGLKGHALAAQSRSPKK